MLLGLSAILAGFGFFWVAGKCKGRNARKAFTYAAWGAWLLLLWFVPLPLFPTPLGILNLILSLTPSAVCFLLAVNSMMKEMRAQKVGEFTDMA